MKTRSLEDCDARYVVERLPRDIRELLTTHYQRLFLGGGFIRATIAGEEPSDIDLFGVEKTSLQAIAESLRVTREGSTLHTSENAITLLTPNRLPIQFITRWTFKDIVPLIESFDFTVCQAAVMRYGSNSNDPWITACGDRFYSDLAARRLFYTEPIRDEEAGGSMLRVIKYVKRGYSIQVESLGKVIARMTKNKPAIAPWDEHFVEQLREVDPLRVVDGLELSQEHHPHAEGATFTTAKYSDQLAVSREREDTLDAEENTP